MASFHSYLRSLLQQAGREAQGDGATTEAQHVLLAMASQAETRELLQSLGLDHGSIRAALDAEFRHTLGAAGVSVAASEVQRGSTASEASPALGPSVHHALQRGLSDRREAPRPAHLLLGILLADVGTVPRALALAGVDRAALITRIRQSLEAE